ncbi:hypothetical protein A4G99_10960 [Haladaptatus sp. R4]|uniref:hypothetical protein n=1 Tax=Haladaptatus sp. R4 TaxID=1679489 RepID=UPI0007B4EE83|nr:hypothetical protein A4G99_10960 [Haladaptatus sp. R4]
MSWRVIAKKEFRDASRSRRLFALILVFVLFFAGTSFVIIKIIDVLAETTRRTFPLSRRS